ncbi:hypothetical protein ACOME3_008801 [Neoechinorhynchus agilis]
MQQQYFHQSLQARPSTLASPQPIIDEIAHRLDKPMLLNPAQNIDSIKHSRYHQRPYNSLIARDMCTCLHQQQYGIEQSNQTDYSDPRATKLPSMDNIHVASTSYGEAQTERSAAPQTIITDDPENEDEADEIETFSNHAISLPQEHAATIPKAKNKRFFTFRLKDSKKAKIKNRSVAHLSRGTQTRPVCILERCKPAIGGPPDHTPITSTALTRYNRPPQSNSIERQIVPRISLPPHYCGSTTPQEPCHNNDWNLRMTQSPIIQAVYSPTLSPAPSVLSLDVVSEALVSKIDKVRSSGWFQYHQRCCNNAMNSRRCFRRSYYGNEPVRCIPDDSEHPNTTTNAIATLAKDERTKIEVFYNSVGSYVYVSTSAAILFTNQLDATLSLTEWKRLYVGVPIWLFNTGVTPKRPRRVQIVMAELGSAFILIDATVDHTSEVRNPRPGYVTLRLKDSRTVIALRFLTVSAADAFYGHYCLLYRDKRNIDIFKPHEITKPAKYRPILFCKKELVSKKKISPPTSFRHLSSLHENQRDNLYSLTALT